MGDPTFPPGGLLRSRRVAAALVAAALVALIGCGGSSSSGGSSGGGLQARALWQQRSSEVVTTRGQGEPGFGPELPASVVTVRFLIESGAGLQCCLAVDPRDFAVDPTTGQRSLLFTELPPGPATLTIAGYPTDFAPAPPGITSKCTTQPADAGTDCDPNRFQTASFESAVQPVSIVSGADTDAGDILIPAVPFLIDGTLSPAPNGQAANPVAVSFTVADASTGIDAASVGVSLNPPPPAAEALTLVACDDSGATPCSPGGALEVSGFQVARPPQSLDVGAATIEISAANLASPAEQLDYTYPFTVLIAPPATPSATATATATATSTAVSTPTATAPETPTQTATFTDTPAATATLTATPTETFTSTPSVTGTPTETPAETPTETATFTGTPTASHTDTATATLTATPTETFTSTPSVTGTPPLTPTATPTSTDTATATATSTATATLTITPTATVTSTSTATVTGTPPPSATPTLTPTPTGTFTLTPTPTATFTSTATVTPTFTQTPTATFTLTPTATSTSTPVPTATGTATVTSTATATATFTQTPPATDTATDTVTATATATATVTDTPTRTSTPTPTFTPAAGCTVVVVTPAAADDVWMSGSSTSWPPPAADTLDTSDPNTNVSQNVAGAVYFCKIGALRFDTMGAYPSGATIPWAVLRLTHVGSIENPDSRALLMRWSDSEAANGWDLGDYQCDLTSDASAVPLAALPPEGGVYDHTLTSPTGNLEDEITNAGFTGLRLVLSATTPPTALDQDFYANSENPAADPPQLIFEYCPAATPTPQALVASGPEFQVNVSTLGYQYGGDVGMDANGNFVAVWQDGGTASVIGRRFDDVGAPLSGEFVIAPLAVGDYLVTPRVAVAPSGDFVVVWVQYNDIFARRYDSLGGALGTSFEVNTGVGNLYSPDVASDADGNFVVVWYYSDFTSIEAQRFDSGGMPLGTEFQVNTYTEGDRGHPAVATQQATGDFAVVWADLSGLDGDSGGVFGQRFASDGSTQGTEFQVNTYTYGSQGDPAAAVDGPGNFVVAWTGGFYGFDQDGNYAGVFAQRFDSGGAATGTEFQVNTYTPQNQAYPAVAVGGAGDFVIVWQSGGDSPGNDGSFAGVSGQHFDSDGMPLGTEFQVNTYTPGSQYGAAIAASGPDFAVVWQSQDEDGSQVGIFGQRFVTSCGDGVVGPGEQCDPPNGTTCSEGCAFPTPTPADTPTPTPTFAFLGTEFQANTYTADFQAHPAVAGDLAGNFVIVWDSIVDGSLGQDGYGYGVFGQRYDSSGAAAGTEFQVNTYTPGFQYFPRVATSPASGDFLVVWEDGSGLDGEHAGIFAQRFDSGGTALGAQFQVNTYTADYEGSPNVSADMNGNFVVVWQQYPGLDGSQNGVFGQRLDSSGNALGTEFQVNTFTPGGQFAAAVAADDGGEFVVVWTDDSYLDGSGRGIFGQRFASDGSAQGTEFQVNTHTAGNQEIAKVARDPLSGDFVVVWHSYAQDGDNFGVFGQRFGSDGSTQGTEFQVNTYTTGRQTYPSISWDRSGEFIVAWSGYFEDGSQYGIFAQRFDSGGAQSGTEFQVNTFTLAQQLGAAVSSTGTSDFVVVWESGNYGTNVYGQRLGSTP
jgi:hypothetical protein